MRMAFLTLILLLFSFCSYAQYNPGNKTGQISKGSISGLVKDKQGGEAIEYANVIVYKSKDSSMVTGALSNNKGKFLIENLSPGKYFVKVNFIGFGIKIISDVFIKPPDNLAINIGTIELETTATNLDAVVISGEKNQIEYNLDKKVINVDKNILSAGGTALDVMQTIPSIHVDIEGTVSLRGSSNVTIFIDGRPSGFTSLDEMPAGMIDKVEIITNPSARYDPDGMSGIINIVTKRKKDPGYNGMVSASTGTNGQYSGSLNLGYSRKKINLFTNIDFRHNRFKSTNNNTRDLFVNDTTNFFDQFNNSIRKGNYANFKLGADYFINSKNTLTFNGVYNFRKGTPNDTTTYKNYDYDHTLIDFYKRGTLGNQNNGGYEFSLDYRKTYDKKGEELTANLFYSNTEGEYNTDLNTLWYDFDQTTVDSIQNQKTSSIYKYGRLQGQVDFVYPMDKWGRIETGYKGSYKGNENDYLLNNYYNELLLKDTLSSNYFAYTEQIHSAYFIYGNNIKKFKFQLGLRAEQVMTVSDQKTTKQIFKHNYFNVFPTIHLKYEFTDHNALQISYSRRVQRPRSNTLNPFVNYTDPMNISTGNPYLEPEFTNSFELEHLIDFTSSTTINTTLFYRETENMITRTVDIDSLGVSRSSYSNLDKGSSFGIELILTQGIFKWWKINGNFSYFGVKFYGNSNTVDFNDINTSWTAKVNSSMTFWKSFDVQLSFNYRSPIFTAQNSGGYFGSSSGGSQGKQSANYFFDIGLKKDFLKNKLTFTLRLSDIFNTNIYELETQGGNYFSNTTRKRETRVLTLGASYKINGGLKQKRKKPAEDNGIDMEE